MTRRWLRGAAAGLAVAAAVLGSAVPAAADPSPQLLVTGMQAVPGQVRFFVAGRDIPAGTALTEANLSVQADGVTLPAKVQPLTGTSGRTVATPPRGVVLVFDASGSMAGASLVAAREAATAYATALPADVALGLVTIADKPKTVLEPGTDRSAFTAAVGTIAAKGGTALYDGVHVAAGLLAAHSDYVERRVVVLTDGEDTASTAKPADVSRELAAGQVRLDAVAFGPQAGGAQITSIATGTGGAVVPAADAAALRSAFSDLAGSVSAPVEVIATVPAALSGHESTLSVTLSAGGRKVANVSTPVSFRVDPRAGATALSRIPAAHLPFWLLVVALSGVGGALLVGAFLTVWLALGRSKLRRRLRELDKFTADRLHAAQAPAGNILMRTALAMSERAVQSRGQQSRIEAALDQGGIDLKPNEWILLRTATTVVGGFLFALMLPWVAGLLIGGVLGWLAPGLYRQFRAGRRARRFADLLPESLQLVVSALRSGFSLPQAIDALVREGPEPVAGEFGRAVAEIRLGGELEDALERTAARNNSRDLAWLVMAIRIQREVGGNLSEVLETAVETMRERARVARHVRALSAEGRMSAYVLIGLPLCLGAYMFLVRRDYVRPLFSTTLGLLMLVGAGIMLGLGTFWMSRVIKVEV